MPGKKIILVYPEGRKKGNYPHGQGHDYTLQMPISLLPIAHFLRRGGYDPLIFDARIEDFRNMPLADVLCVGFSCMTNIQIANALEIASYARDADVSIPLVWGGIHPSLLPEQTAAHELVDIVVRREGEATMLDLVQRLEADQPLESLPGITYKRNGLVVTNPDRDFIDLNLLANLPYDLLQLEKYDFSETGFYLSTSRGCPHSCDFCYNFAFHRRRWRCQSAEVVVAEIEKVVTKYGIRKFYVAAEDNFFVSKKRVREICQGLLKRGLSVEWEAFCRADYVSRYNDEFLGLLRDAGCKQMYIGGESGSERMLKLMAKNTHPSDLLTAALKCKGVGIKPVFSFISGFPYETDDDLRASFNMIDRVFETNRESEVNGIFPLAPYPGTPVFALAKEAGLKEPSRLEDWAQYQFGDTSLLPWLSANRKRFLATLFRLSRFPFAGNNSDLPPLLRRQGHSSLTGLPIRWLKKVAWLILWMSARLRWKYKFFALAIEWRLWDWYCRRQRIW